MAFLSQQSREKRNKIKIEIFHLHVPFSKSYPETEATWPTAKCKRRNSFDTWYYMVTCAMLCVSFSSKSETINVFLKHLLKSKACDQSNQAGKKLICHVIVKSYSSNYLWKFLIKIESTWRRKIKEQAPQLALPHRGRTVRSSHWRCCIRKLFLKILQYYWKNLCWSLFLKSLQTFRPAPQAEVFLWLLQNF